MIYERVGERPPLYTRARMHNQTGRLINHDKVIIFIDDLYRYRVRRKLGWRRLGQIKLYAVAPLQAIARLDRVLVYKNVAIFYCPLYARAADMVEAGGEKRIEARARARVVNRYQLSFAAHLLRIRIRDSARAS
jgi:hypothetical protein